MAYKKYGKLDFDSLQMYLREISKIPQLTVEQEQELGRRIKDSGDRDAVRQLVEANLRFVVSFAKKYRNSPMNIIDIIEEGNLGLIEAAKRFDPDRGNKFITYAAWWIRQAIIHALGEQGRTVRLPQRQANLLYQLGKQFNELKASLNRNPTTEELAAEMDITVEKADELLKLRTEDLSLDASLDENSNVDLGDIVATDNSPPIDLLLVKESCRKQVQQILHMLNDRERYVIEERFGFNASGEPQTLQFIGDSLGVSRERVRQIEQQALKKLRENARKQKLRTFLN
jgi:RNA polymerase primary sigma factor